MAGEKAKMPEVHCKAGAISSVLQMYPLPPGAQYLHAAWAGTLVSIPLSNY